MTHTPETKVFVDDMILFSEATRRVHNHSLSAKFLTYGTNVLGAILLVTIVGLLGVYLKPELVADYAGVFAKAVTDIFAHPGRQIFTFALQLFLLTMMNARMNRIQFIATLYLESSSGLMDAQMRHMTDQETPEEKDALLIKFFSPRMRRITADFEEKKNYVMAVIKEEFPKDLLEDRPEHPFLDIASKFELRMTWIMAALMAFVVADILQQARIVFDIYFG